jgi:hypothetical protein
LKIEEIQNSVISEETKKLNKSLLNQIQPYSQSYAAIKELVTSDQYLREILFAFLGPKKFKDIFISLLDKKQHRKI